MARVNPLPRIFQSYVRFPEETMIDATDPFGPVLVLVPRAQLIRPQYYHSAIEFHIIGIGDQVLNV